LRFKHGKKAITVFYRASVYAALNYHPSRMSKSQAIALLTLKQ